MSVGMMAASAQGVTGVPATAPALWLDASDDASFTYSSGVLVSQWNDLSGNGRHLTGSAVSGSAPTRVAASMKGLPSVRVQGSQLTVANFTSAWTAGEMIVVLKMDFEPSLAGDGCPWTLASSGSVNHYPYSDGFIQENFGTTVRKTVGVPPFSVIVPHIYNVRSAAGAFSAHINGSQIYTTASNTVGFSTNPVNFGISHNTSYYMTGNFAEILLYNRILGDSERTAIIDSLTAKWLTPPACTSVLHEPFSTLNRWTSVTSAGLEPAGRNGAALYVDSSGGSATYSIPAASRSEWVTLGFAYKAPTLVGDQWMYDTKSNGNTQITGVAKASGEINFRRFGTSGTDMATTTGAGLVAGTWAYIEVTMRIHQTLGQIICNVNGVQKLNATGLNTRGGATTTTDTLIMHGYTGIQLFDDLYVSTGSPCTFQGDHAETGECATVLAHEQFNSLAAWTGVTNVDIGAGRNGTAARSFANDSAAWFPVPALSENAWITVGFAWKSNFLSIDNWVFQLRSDAGATMHLRFMASSSGTIYTWHGSGSFVGSSTAGMFTENVWAYIEVQAYLHDTAGRVIIRVNGVECFNYTGDTRNGGTKTTFDMVGIVGNTGANQLFDDMYISTGIDCPFRGDIVPCTDVLVHEQFNNFTDAPWTNSGASIVTGRVGTGAGVGGTSNNISHQFTPAEYLTIGFAFRSDQIGSARAVAEFWSDGANTQSLIRTQTGGALSLHRGTTQIGTSSGVTIVANTWYYIELQIRLHNTLGTAVIRVDGVEVINFAGDTMNSGTTSKLNLVVLRPSTSATNNVYDDLYLSTGSDCAFKGDPLDTPLTIGWHSAFWASDPAWTPPADGAAVSTWHNAGFANADATQATGALQPTYRASFAGLNGQPAIEFAGDYLDTLSASNTQPNHIFVVAWLNPTHTGAQTLVDGAAGARGQLRNNGTGSTLEMYAGGTTGGGTTEGGIDGPFAIFGYYNALLSTIRINGTDWYVNGDSGSNPVANLRIGADQAGGLPFTGAIAFIGVTDLPLNASQIARLETWARDTYDTPAATPHAAPYIFAVSSPIAAHASGTTITPVFPAGYQADDIAIMAVSANASLVTLSTPSGWTPFGTEQITDANFATAWYWRRLTASETNPTLTAGVTFSSVLGGYARIYIFRGCTTTGDPFESVAHDGSPTLSTVPSTAAITTTGPNRLAVCIVLVDDDNTWSTQMNPATWQSLGSRSVSTVGADALFDGIAKEVPTATTVAAANFGTMSGSDYWRTMTLALLPPAPPCSAVLREPFDNLTAWTNTGATIVAGRTGTAAQASGTTNSATYTIPAASESDTITVGFAWRYTDVGNTLEHIVARFYGDAGSTRHASLNILPRQGASAWGVIGVYKGDGSGFIGSSVNTAAPLVQNTWYYIEVQMKLHDTTGFVKVRIDGVEVINATNVDTKNGGTKTTYDRVRLGESGSGPLVGQYDDLYLSTGPDCALQGVQSIYDEVLMEPFNNFTDAPWDIGGGAATIVAGRTGTAARSVTTNGPIYQIPTDDLSISYTVGFAFRTTALPGGDRPICQFRTVAGSGNMFNIGIRSTGELIAERVTTVLGTSAAGLITINTWHYIEMKITISNTAGMYELRVNGATVIGPVANVDTNGGFTEGQTPGQVALLSGSGVTSDFDDFYLTTGGGPFKGDITVP